MKRMLITCLVITLAMSSLAYAAGEPADANIKAYTDVKADNWAYEAIDAMSKRDIVEGYEDGSFKPRGVLTYGEFIKMAVLTSGAPDPGNAEKPDNWAQKYYDKGIELKYYTEQDIAKAQLKNPIPRQDMALIISAQLGEVKLDHYDAIQKGITDVTAKTRNEYDIIKSYGAGILTGYEDKTFQPEKTLTRAESAVVAHRMVDESKRKMPSIEEPKKEEKPSKTGTDIASMIENYKTYEQEKIDIGYGSTLAEAERYEMIDPAGYKVEAIERNGTKAVMLNGKWPLELGWGNLYLMKDKKIMYMTQDGIYDDVNRMKEHIDITTIEYFVFTWYQQQEELLGIMPNPLYVK